MALRVPGYGQSETAGPRVNLAPMPELQRNPSAPIEAFGGGALPEQQARSAAQISQAADRTNDAAQELAITYRNQADASLVLANNLKNSKVKNDALEKLKTFKGPDSVNKYDEIYNEAKIKMLDGIKEMTERQQGLAQPYINSLLNDFDREGTSYKANEVTRFSKGAALGNMDLADQQAALYADVPGKLQEQLGKKLNATEIYVGMDQGVHVGVVDGKEMAVNPDGTPASQLEQDTWGRAKLASTTGFHLAVIKAQLDDFNDPDAATAYFHANKAEIDQKLWPGLQNNMHGAAENKQARKIALRIFHDLPMTDSLGPNGEPNGRIARIDAIRVTNPGLSFKVTTALNLLDSEDKKAQAAALDKKVSDIHASLYDAKKNGVTDPQQVIPATQWEQLSPEQQKIYRKVLTPGNTGVTSYTKIWNVPGTEFGKIPLGQFQNLLAGLSETDRPAAKAYYAEAVKDINSPNVTKQDKINQYARDVWSKIPGINSHAKIDKQKGPDGSNYAEFHTSFMREVREFETNYLGGKRPANKDEIRKIADDMLIETTTNKTFGIRTGGSLGYQEVSKIPDDTLTSIDDFLIKNQIPVTEKNRFIRFQRLNQVEQNAK